MPGFKRVTAGSHCAVPPERVIELSQRSHIRYGSHGLSAIGGPAARARCRQLKALFFVAMAETATIRVDRDVRDQLALVAEQNGISLAGLLRRYAREQMLESERAARRLADASSEAIAEQDDWDSTVGDGIT